MPPSVTLLPSTVTVRPGGADTCEVRVRNTGTVVEQFTFSLVGSAAAWAVVDPTELRLFPDQDGSATIRFEPPADASVPAGSVPFGVRVVPTSDPASAIVEEGVVEVAGFSVVTADLSPRNIEGQSGTHTITINNAGNAPAEARVEAHDPDERTVHTLSASEVVVPPGGQASVGLKVAARGGKGRAPRRMGYQILVTPRDQPPIRLEGSLSQAASRRKAPWLIAAALLVVVGLVAFLAVRPKVESASKEITRIRAEVASAQKAVEEAEEKIAEAKKDTATAKQQLDEAGRAVGAAKEGVGSATGAADPTTSTSAGAPSGSDEAATTTSGPSVAAGSLSGARAFGTTEQKVTCIGNSGPGAAATTTTAGR